MIVEERVIVQINEPLAGAAIGVVGGQGHRQGAANVRVRGIGLALHRRIGGDRDQLVIGIKAKPAALNHKVIATAAFG